MKRNIPLRVRLTLGLLMMQLILLIGASTFMVITVFQLPINGSFLALNLTSEIGKSMQLDPEGHLVLEPTPKLQEYINTSPDLWMIVHSEAYDQTFRYGPVPESLKGFEDIMPVLAHVDIRGTAEAPEIISRFRPQSTELGQIGVLSGGGAFVPSVFILLLFGNLFVAVPIIALIVLTVIFAPLIITYSLRGLKKLELEMAEIDISTRGTRLSQKGVPKELLPLVGGINDALTRLDVGIEATERFFVHAAHELRTPIAVMQIRVDDLENSPEKEKLRAMLRRLRILVNQLLELERFRQSPADFSPTNIVQVAEKAIIDLAPYAVAEGYSISLEKAADEVWVRGDAYALDRMVVNLIQNAIQHGGKRGEIVIRVTKSGSIEVEDDGPGIPWERRFEIFEPFVRVSPHGGGTGLGLKMVKDVALAHGGDVVLAKSSTKGATFRVTLPVLELPTA